MKAEYEKQMFQFSDKLSNLVIPKNFSQVNEGLYRGSWPKTIDFLLALNITDVVTLYSSDDEEEAIGITDLQKKISEAGINHTIIDVKSNEDLWRAAIHIYNLDRRIYVHCRAGANRTSMVCLILEILQLGPDLASKALPMLIQDAISHGFDYHKLKHRQVLSDILSQAERQGLLLK